MVKERFTHRFVVSEHLEVAWDDEEKRVQVLVDGKPIGLCTSLVANIDEYGEGPEQFYDENINSIDRLLNQQFFNQDDSIIERNALPIEEEVAAHASNIQAWAENEYSANLLHSSIAFPLLKELARLGDAKAKQVINAELLDRFSNGIDSTREALLGTIPEMKRLATFLPMIADLSLERRKELLALLGKALGDRQEYDLAISAYREAIALIPKKSEFILAWIDYANKLIDLGKMKVATMNFGHVMTIPPSVQWWGELANQIRQNIGYVPDVIKWYRRWLDLNSDDWSSLMNLAGALHRSGDIDGARHTVEKVLSLRPDDYHAWGYLGDLQKSKGDGNDALKSYQKTIALNPKNSDVLCMVRIWTNLMILLRNAGDEPGEENARNTLETMIGKMAQKNLGWETVAQLHAMNGDDSAAISTYKRALSIMERRSDLSIAWENLGDSLNLRKDIRNALFAYQEACGRYPYESASWRTIAEKLETMGELERSKDAYLEAIRCDPTDEVLIQHLEKTGISLPTLEYAKAWNEQSEIMYKKGEFKAAIEAARKALSLACPKDSKASIYYLSLGEALEKTKDFKGANDAYRKAVDLDSIDGHVKFLLKRLRV